MKEKILVFIIGLLLGAILASGGFLIYEKNNSSNVQNETNTQMTENSGRGMPNGETPPDKPDGNQSGRPSMNKTTDTSNVNSSK